MRRACENCVFYHRLNKAREGVIKEVGQCRFNPPPFPVVTAERDWCGKFKGTETIVVSGQGDECTCHENMWGDGHHHPNCPMRHETERMNQLAGAVVARHYGD